MRVSGQPLFGCLSRLLTLALKIVSEPLDNYVSRALARCRLDGPKAELGKMNAREKVLSFAKQDR